MAEFSPNVNSTPFSNQRGILLSPPIFLRKSASCCPATFRRCAMDHPLQQMPQEFGKIPTDSWQFVVPSKLDNVILFRQALCPKFYGGAIHPAADAWSDRDLIAGAAVVCCRMFQNTRPGPRHHPFPTLLPEIRLDKR